MNQEVIDLFGFTDGTFPNTESELETFLNSFTYNESYSKDPITGNIIMFDNTPDLVDDPGIQNNFTWDMLSSQAIIMPHETLGLGMDAGEGKFLIGRITLKNTANGNGVITQILGDRSYNFNIQNGEIVRI